MSCSSGVPANSSGMKASTQPVGAVTSSTVTSWRGGIEEHRAVGVVIDALAVAHGAAALAFEDDHVEAEGHLPVAEALGADDLAEVDSPDERMAHICYAAELHHL